MAYRHHKRHDNTMYYLFTVLMLKANINANKEMN